MLFGTNMAILYIKKHLTMGFVRLVNAKTKL